MKHIYLDNASTTVMAPEVLEAMMPYFREVWGNPSSVHGPGREARRAVELARKQTGELLGADPRDIYFTSGGSESDNWALKGAAFALREKGRRIITTSIEHHAVLHTCRWLEKQGFEVVYLPVDAEGRVDPAEVERSATEGTILISVMTANNEIGTLEPVEEIGRMAREKGILFHTDAVQAAGALPLDVNRMNIDLLSLSAHKFHGPRGIGALYVRGGTRLDSLIHGGAQERGRRAGTENTAAIAGLGRAAEMAMTSLRERNEGIRVLRDRMIRGVLEGIPGSRLDGPAADRLPNNCHFSFDGVDGEALLLRMDLAGIACSGGSACTAGSRDPSHVLLAIGRGEREAGSGIRLTLSDGNTEEEVDTAVKALTEIVADLRRMTNWLGESTPQSAS